MRPPPSSTLFPYTTLFRSKFAYMPPEQLRGKGVDRRADVWSLGVLLWETIAAAKLFHRGNDSERSEEHTSELQSRRDLVCRLLLEKKNINNDQLNVVLDGL